MSTIQHEGARKLLKIIWFAEKQKTPLTYEEAASRLGRTPPKDNARTVAQMCDLLDAAAALAGVPSLALIKVLNHARKINPKAWREDSERREAIIARSQAHQFANSDIQAISSALKRLKGLGNRKAWAFVELLFPGEAYYRRLLGLAADENSDAISDINDIGTDSPDRAKTVGYSYARNQKIRNAVLRRANGNCEFCGEPGFMKSNGKRYLECHHIIALAKQGKDRMTNVIALCPNDHREAHFGENGEEIEAEMIQKVKAIQGSHLRSH